MGLIDWFRRVVYPRNIPKDNSWNTETGRRGKKGERAAALGYNPMLLSHLVDEHRRLGQIAECIHEAYDSKNIKEILRHLHEFRSAVIAHLQREDEQLYHYLEWSLSYDRRGYVMMHGIAHEVERIGKRVMGFLQKYDTLGQDSKLLRTFGPDFSVITGLLERRIEREENVLFPLYRPSADKRRGSRS